MFIHAAVHRIARKSVVLHTHMPFATALTLTAARALDTTLSQTAMRFHGRLAVDAHYNGLALDMTEGERIAHAMQGADVVFLGNHGVIVCGERVDYAYDDLYYLERACQAQVLAASTGVPLMPVDTALAARIGPAARRLALPALGAGSGPSRPMVSGFSRSCFLTACGGCWGEPPTVMPALESASRWFLTDSCHLLSALG